MFRLLFLSLCACLITACGSIESRPPFPTDAQIEQYNALATHEQQIVCMEVTELGSRRPQRSCYRRGYLESQAKQGQSVVDAMRADGLLTNPLHF